MKIRTAKELKELNAALNKCTNPVWLMGPNDEAFNMMDEEEYIEGIIRLAEDHDDQLGIFTPYGTAKFQSSPLEKTLREQIQSGKQLLVFSALDAPEGLAEALKAYAAEPTDENWAIVTDILE